MNKKQIYKVEVKSKSWGSQEPDRLYEGYGISIGDDLLLLEDGRVLKTPDGDGNSAIRQSLYDYNHNFGQYMQLNNQWRDVGETTVGATRNVPAAVRGAMEDAAVAAMKMCQMAEKFKKMQDAFNEQMKEEEEKVKSMPAAVRQEKGLLSKKEFLEAFVDALPQNVRDAMENSQQRGCYGMDGKYEVTMWKNIQIDRSVMIEKWATPNFVYEEYDHTIQMRGDAKDYPSYQQLISNYSRPLPVSKNTRFDEYLSMGDKDTLEYHGGYLIVIDQNRPLTMDYAAELADDFAGEKRKKRDDIEKLIDEDDYLDER